MEMLSVSSPVTKSVLAVVFEDDTFKVKLNGKTISQHDDYETARSMVI